LLGGNAEDHMALGGSSIELASEAESRLCDAFDRTVAIVRRVELWGLYEISRHLHELKAQAGQDLRRSLLRCGKQLGKDRTTLLRYAFVHQRIRISEFGQLVAMSDYRGYPASFWDFVEVAHLSLEERREEIERRLSARHTTQDVAERKAVGPAVVKTTMENLREIGERA
jgi:hypothetical protein